MLPLINLENARTRLNGFEIFRRGQEVDSGRGSGSHYKPFADGVFSILSMVFLEMPKALAIQRYDRPSATAFAWNDNNASFHTLTEQALFELGGASQRGCHYPTIRVLSSKAMPLIATTDTFQPENLSIAPKGPCAVHPYLERLVARTASIFRT